MKYFNKILLGSAVLLFLAVFSPPIPAKAAPDSGRTPSGVSSNRKYFDTGKYQVFYFWGQAR